MFRLYRHGDRGVRFVYAGVVGAHDDEDKMRAATRYFHKFGLRGTPGRNSAISYQPSVT